MPFSPESPARGNTPAEEFRHLVRLAQDAEDAGDFDGAVGYYREALAASPMRADLRTALADALSAAIERRGAPVPSASVRLSAEPHAWRPTTPEPVRITPSRPVSGAVRLPQEAAPPPARNSKPAFPAQEQFDLFGTTPPVQRVAPKPKPTRPAPPRRKAESEFANALFGARERVSRIQPTHIALGLVAAGVLLLTAGLTTSAVMDWVATKNAPKTVARKASPADEAIALASNKVLAGESDVALATLREAREKYPDKSTAIDSAMLVALKAEGTTAAQSKDWSRAADAFKEATTLDAATPDVWMEYGRILREQSKAKPKKSADARRLLASSETAYRRALEASPADAGALLGLAQVYTAQNNKTKAISTYKSVVKHAPGSSEAKVASVSLKKLGVAKK